MRQKSDTEKQQERYDEMIRNHTPEDVLLAEKLHRAAFGGEMESQPAPLYMLQAFQLNRNGFKLIKDS